MSKYVIRVSPRSPPRLNDEKDGARPKVKKRSPQRGFDRKSNVLLRANRACDVSPIRSPNRSPKDRVIHARNTKAFNSKQAKTDEVCTSTCFLFTLVVDTLDSSDDDTNYRSGLPESRSRKTPMLNTEIWRQDRARRALKSKPSTKYSPTK